jgi:capsular exopolysaccharide synthesis family protein
MLIENPIVDTIRQIYSDHRTGCLRLEKDGNQIIINFGDGFINAASSTITPLQMGRLFAGKNIMPLAAVPKLIQYARRKRILMGNAAVQCKLLDDAELRETIHEQIVGALSHAIANEFAERPFEDSHLDIYLPARLDPDSLVLKLARANLTPMQLAPNSLLCLSNGKPLSHYPWFPQELSVLGCLKTPCSLQDLAMATGIEYSRLGKILCVFNSMDLIRQIDAVPAESTALIKREGFPFEHLTPEIGNTALDIKLETLHNPSSFISEQFKTLKVRLAEAAARSPLRVIAISSPHMGDGKSLVCANLGISLSRDGGRRVVVVDCDLRNPSLHTMFGASIEPGLLGYLEANTLPAYCYLRRLDKLFVMTAGGFAANPIELLSNARMQELISYLKSEFDVVILDCPPFGLISDAQILTGLSDGFLLVVRCGKTTYGTMEKALGILDRSKLVGLIFNDVKPMMFNTQYPYKYYYYRKGGNYPYGKMKPSRPSKNYLDL